MGVLEESKKEKVKRQKAEGSKLKAEGRRHVAEEESYR